MKYLSSLGWKRVLTFILLIIVLWGASLLEPDAVWYTYLFSLIPEIVSILATVYLVDTIQEFRRKERLRGVESMASLAAKSVLSQFRYKLQLICNLTEEEIQDMYALHPTTKTGLSTRSQSILFFEFYFRTPVETKLGFFDKQFLEFFGEQFSQLHTEATEVYTLHRANMPLHYQEMILEIRELADEIAAYTKVLAAGLAGRERNEYLLFLRLALDNGRNLLFKYWPENEEILLL